MNLAEYNAKFKSMGCPRCGAWKGDPCRTPGWKITRPHKERVKFIKALDTVEKRLGSRSERTRETK